MGSLENRVIRLEQRGASSWRSLVGTPMQNWPNWALEVMSRDEDDPPQHPFTDAELQALLDATEAIRVEQDASR